MVGTFIKLNIDPGGLKLNRQESLIVLVKLFSYCKLRILPYLTTYRVYLVSQVLYQINLKTN